MERIAHIVTTKDILNYFTGHESGWETNYGEGEIKAISNKKRYEVLLNGIAPIFHLHIEASDDSSDFDDILTDDPTSAMVDFLESDSISGVFKKKSASLSYVSASLIDLSNVIDKCESVSIKNVKKQIARIMIASNADMFNDCFHRLARHITQYTQFNELENIKNDMRKMGFDAVVHESDPPYVEIDVHGVYTATITVHSISYDYEFKVIGVPEADESGVTNDPIDAYGDWTHKPDTIEARNKSTEESEKQKSVETSDAPTVAPMHKS